MDWSTILKADKPIDVEWDEELASVGQWLYPVLGGGLTMQSDSSWEYNSPSGTIKISPKKLFTYVKILVNQKGESMDDLFEKDESGEFKLESGKDGKMVKVPTKKLENYLAQAFDKVARHEAGHGSHYLTDPKMRGRSAEEKEYIAHILEFPNSVVRAYEEYLTHKASVTDIDRDKWREYDRPFGGRPLWPNIERKLNPLAELVASRLNYVSRWTNNPEDKEKLLRMELAWAKSKWGKLHKTNFPSNLKEAIRRYGDKHKTFLNRIFGQGIIKNLTQINKPPQPEWKKQIKKPTIEVEIQPQVNPSKVKEPAEPDEWCCEQAKKMFKFLVLRLHERDFETERSITRTGTGKIVEDRPYNDEEKLKLKQSQAAHPVSIIPSIMNMDCDEFIKYVYRNSNIQEYPDDDGRNIYMLDFILIRIFYEECKDDGYEGTAEQWYTTDNWLWGDSEPRDNLWDKV